MVFRGFTWDTVTRLLSRADKQRARHSIVDAYLSQNVRIGVSLRRSNFSQREQHSPDLLPEGR